ncbi:MAG: hypothetical protein FJ386_08210 [Verrucomicrobia bacterium]|nr:hypothetical protein [Verrucomicrobiota bacterium]
MRSLAKPAVLRASLCGGVFTALACWPRLALWFERPDALSFLLAVVFVCGFFLWNFVFGWHGQYSGRPVFVKLEPKLWAAVTVAAIVVALAKLFFTDPVLRPLRPDDFPKDLPSLAASILFGIGLTSSLLVFAPFALFMRLTGREQWSAGGTILVGVFVAFVAAGSKQPPLPAHVLAGVLAGWAAGGAWGVWLYLRGGAGLVWWWLTVIQARHLAEVL